MIKAKFDTRQLSVKIGVVFARTGISPNMWTVFALIPAAAGYLALASGNLLLGLLLFILSGAVDTIDGAVARVTQSESALGAFLDGIIDRYVEILLYLGLMSYLGGYHTLIVLLIFGAMMTSFTRAYADHRKVVTEEEDLVAMGGLLERFERLVLVYAGMLAGLASTTYLVYAIAAAAILSNATAAQRIHYTVKYRR